MKLDRYPVLAAILTLPSGAPPLYPGDCIPTPGGPLVTARVVQALSYDPPRFEIAFERCKVTERVAREEDDRTASPVATGAGQRR